MVFIRSLPAKILLSTLFLLMMNGCALSKQSNVDEINVEPQIRVAILAGLQNIAITGEKINLKVNKKEIFRSKGSLLVDYKTGGFVVGKETYYSDKLIIYGRHLRVGGRAYRGSLTIIHENSSLTLINNLGLEAYLFGLINLEISSAWPMEAVKSQAVAARSYAYQKIRSNEMNRYHLLSSVLDQVYGGQSSEDERAREAVNKTRGEVVVYDGYLANTFYHSNCGGQTESAENVWGTDFQYLRTVNDENCTNAPNYFWSYNTTFSEIRNKLFLNEKLADRRLKIKILERTKSGRVKAIKVGKKVLTGEDLRKMIGYGNIKSTRFQMESNGYLIEFKGSGHGHGVGMCQWGAKGMAEKNYNYREILRYYYPGTDIKRVY